MTKKLLLLAVLIVIFKYTDWKGSVEFTKQDS